MAQIRWKPLLFSMFCFACGQISAEPIKEMSKVIARSICGAPAALARGKALIIKAATSKSPVFYRDADLAFSEAAECWLSVGRLQEGNVWRGWLRLHGLGFPADRQKGLSMIREALWDEPRLAVDWTDQTGCGPER
jgi:hypothetical protein